ncbi:MAG: rod shape-determining protein RodA [Bacteroidetes bacterium]|nr:rod shape-determining protein RodA [Bacteroidota bacterium]
MERAGRTIFSNVDWILISLYAILVILGWLNIYAAVFDEQHKNIFDITQQYGKQMIWIGAAVILAAIILLIDVKFYSAFSYILYGLGIISLIIVFIIGKEISGSRSWFQVGGFGVQPSEFVKFTTSLLLARYISTLHIDLQKTRHLMVALLIIFFPAALILLQNDTGSAIVFSAFMLVLFRFGMPLKYLLIPVAIVLLFLLSLMVDKLILTGIIALILIIPVIRFRRKISRKQVVAAILIALLGVGTVFTVDFVFHRVLEPHQRQRMEVLIGKETDLKGAGYNINQSLIAIGSGRLTGKGYLQGTQTKYDFVPEQSTDFIFCTVGEEWGFLGSLVVIALFVGLLVRIILVAERQRSIFSQAYGYGVACILLFHFAINIGMTLGLVPVIGIPLPFFSYGGSSLWAFTILLFIFIKLDASRYEFL